MIHDYSLKAHNSFHFDVKTKYFTQIHDVKEVRELLLNPTRVLPLFVLGGGSNVLFREDFSGHIITPVNDAVEIMSENSESLFVRVGAGLEWDDFVAWSVQQGLGGIENLSYIPGKVGAAPVQNIGAYGVEVKDCINTVEGIYLDTGETFCIEAEACLFGYRDSIFKQQLKGKVFISHVNFELKKHPVFNLDYGSIKEKLAKLGKINLLNIRNTIIQIRKEKLPDPDVIGNAGSFFKNPVINKIQFQLIKKEYPNIPFYEFEDKIKIPAAWLIDTAGWKGVRQGDAGVHENQALVLVNYGEASPKDIISLAEQITLDIKYKFGIELDKEVSII
jgi:UDP-N-acetylmuramate dehydrogenase